MQNQTDNQPSEHDQKAVVDIIDVCSFFSEMKNLRILNLVLHAQTKQMATVGDIALITGINVSAIGAIFIRSYGTVFGGEVIWKRIRQYYVLQSAMPIVSVLWPFFKDLGIFRKDREQFDQLLILDALPSGYERNFRNDKRVEEKKKAAKRAKS